MKKIIFQAALAVGIFFSISISVNAQAQESANEPYWVTESNAVSRDYTIVRFYNPQHQLIYEEKLEGVYLDATRKKTKRMLAKALQGVVERSILANQYFRSYPQKKRLAAI